MGLQNTTSNTLNVQLCKGFNVAAEISGNYSRDWVDAKLVRLVETLGEVLDEALSTDTPTNEVADRIARERIAAAT